ncbi:unnamed protein product [Kuraishia capsulata CBS 1993]|uniref:Mitochondrial import inner membrane translocase subunit TIM23 n=1 Tax=Kuraishia capsulata CBS 1993 TaxID=1382522 RepID=W6MJM0_9ASCO|nr:uncharacterized protein KUCA_T00002713001 [Kuraishia capsulata CBS 1993]CDK26739.1 unnamed protein product [Kuraishia capsulata CBS 1993]
MSWLLGSSKKEEQPAAPAPSSLPFDPSTLTDISVLNETSRLHPLAGLDKGIEYLDLEDEALSSLEGSQGVIASRGWSDDLCYGTGTLYLLGLGVGGAYGLSEGINAIPKGENVPGKLKLNTILNHVTKRGPFLGNSAGVLALSYNLINSSLDAFRGKHDDLNSLAAGALAGALYKSSKGLKPMGIASAVMTVGAGAWCGLKRYLV